MTYCSEQLKTPGERLKYVRERLLRLSRSDVYKKYGISPDTLAAWENGKIKVSEKGVDRCIRAYGSEKLIMSREWILSGEGLSPKFTFDLNRYFDTLEADGYDDKLDDSILLAKEIEFFRSLASNSITGLISTDEMLPFYSKGDYVGGRFKYKNHLDDCVGKNCIVKTKDGDIYIRRVSKNSNGKGFNLACLNPEWEGSPEPVLFGVEIECAAPIIWHRRLDE